MEPESPEHTCLPQRLQFAVPRWAGSLLLNTRATHSPVPSDFLVHLLFYLVILRTKPQVTSSFVHVQGTFICVLPRFTSHRPNPGLLTL